MKIHLFGQRVLVHSLCCLGETRLDPCRNPSFVRNFLHLVTVDMRCLQALPGALLYHLEILLWMKVLNADLVKENRWWCSIRLLLQIMGLTLCVCIEPESGYLTIAEFPAIRWKVWTRFKSALHGENFCVSLLLFFQTNVKPPAVSKEKYNWRSKDFCSRIFVWNLPEGEEILDNQGIIEPIGRSEKFYVLSKRVQPHHHKKSAGWFRS